MTRREAWKKLFKATAKTRFGFDDIAFVSTRAAQVIETFTAAKRK